ncbi:MAG: nodulation protein NfeD [Balneolaceae bacterium]|nr:MAG: nodulation protein NfeD [Balneolaceae bacterium]
MKRQKKSMFLAVLPILLAVNIIVGQTSVEIPTRPVVYVIDVEGLIDNGLHKYIQRGLATAEANNADGVILHMDTFGGLVDAADKIRKNLLDSPLTTITFIDKNAASAGALISLATDSIFMAPGASIGAATVVEGGSGDKASEKMQSYMRGLMRATAEAKGRNPQIAEAMVDESIEIEGIIAEGKLLTLSTSEAINFGVINGSFRTKDEILAHMGWQNAEVVHLQELWQESVLRFLTHPVVSSIMMLMMLGGLYFELQSPGIGFAGMVAGVGAMMFFAPLYIMGLAQSWEIVLFFIGVVLIIIEIFFIPGFGVAGGLGISLVIFSLGASLIGNVGLRFPPMEHISMAVWTLTITLVIGILLLMSLARYLPQNQMFSRLVLMESTDRNTGYTSAKSLDDLLGMEGVTITPLRPSGMILVDDRRVDVISDGEFVENGARVRVVDTGSSRVVVKKI